MISLTRLSGSVFALNPDLIERIDHTPDTVITLIDGSKYLVAESLAGVVAIIRHHRAEIVALSGMIGVGQPAIDQGGPWPAAPAANTNLLSAAHGIGDGDDARLERLVDTHAGRPNLSVVSHATPTSDAAATTSERGGTS